MNLAIRVARSTDQAVGVILYLYSIPRDRERKAASESAAGGFINGKNLIDLQTTINSELAEISTWLKINKLSLNVKKTHHMIFTHKRKIQPSVALSIEGHPIDEVDNTKFLGVYLDNKINWKKHISYIPGKVARGIGLIIKARKMLTSDALLTLYHSFVFPYLSYCNHIWGCTCPTNLKQLVVQQKIIIRIIAGMKYRDPTESAFRDLSVIRFLDINKYLTARFICINIIIINCLSFSQIISDR